MPGVKGPCKSKFKRWTFMEKWGCYSFQWGGCGGNSNTFCTKKDCLRRCNNKEGDKKGMT